MTDLADRVADAVAEQADLLIEVSHQIWNNPELCFEETFAHDLLCGHLEAAGLEVERGALRPRHRLRGQNRLGQPHRGHLL